jgi:hypothetical protein
MRPALRAMRLCRASDREYGTVAFRYQRIATSIVEMTMRRIILSLAVAAVIGVGLATATPASAYSGFTPYGVAYYDHDGWRERAWREHEWRDRQAWAWRHHMWREWHERHGGYGY